MMKHSYCKSGVVLPVESTRIGFIINAYMHFYIKMKWLQLQILFHTGPNLTNLSFNTMHHAMFLDFAMNKIPWNISKQQLFTPFFPIRNLISFHWNLFKFAHAVSCFLANTLIILFCSNSLLWIQPVLYVLHICNACNATTGNWR